MTTGTGYPRACGDRARGMQRAIEDDGLSPRLRGSVQHRAAQRGEERVIPAPAGIGITRVPIQ